MKTMLNSLVSQRRKSHLPGRQAGASLMELLIGLALSGVVVTSMVILMSNSMGTATRITQMSQLTDELRNTMSMLTRDLRRANYNANAIYCYANSECGDVDNGSAIQAGDLVVANLNTGQSCITFGLDRNSDGDASTDNAGAFRVRQVQNAAGRTVGQVEMWVGGASPDCSQNIDSTEPDIAEDDWVAITDPKLVDITWFNVDNSALAGSYQQELLEEDEVTLVQNIRYVNLELEGQLNLDNTISRRVADRIKVRNDFYEHIEPL
jgi:type II secretory pathway component PulJ